MSNLLKTSSPRPYMFEKLSEQTSVGRVLKAPTAKPVQPKSKPRPEPIAVSPSGAMGGDPGTPSGTSLLTSQSAAAGRSMGAAAATSAPTFLSKISAQRKLAAVGAWAGAMDVVRSAGNRAMGQVGGALSSRASNLMGRLAPKANPMAGFKTPKLRQQSLLQSTLGKAKDMNVLTKHTPTATEQMTRGAYGAKSQAPGANGLLKSKTVGTSAPKSQLASAAQSPTVQMAQIQNVPSSAATQSMPPAQAKGGLTQSASAKQFAQQPAAPVAQGAAPVAAQAPAKVDTSSGNTAGGAMSKEQLKKLPWSERVATHGRNLSSALPQEARDGIGMGAGLLTVGAGAYAGKKVVDGANDVKQRTMGYMGQSDPQANYWRQP